MSEANQTPAADAAEQDIVVRTQDGATLLLRMNRPKTCNAMNLAMYRVLIAYLREAEQDPSVGCIVLTGTGDYFSSGRDLRERNVERPAAHEYFESSMYSHDGPGYFYDFVARYRKPIITAINGPAVGGGAITAFLGDISVASESAYFALPELERGVTAVGATMVFPRLISRAKGMLLVLTCRRCPAPEAERIGLISMVVPPADVLPTALQLAREIGAKSGVAIRLFKTALQAGPWGVSITEDIVRESLRSLAETTPERYAHTRRALEGITTKPV